MRSGERAETFVSLALWRRIAEQLHIASRQSVVVIAIEALLRDSRLAATDAPVVASRLAQYSALEVGRFGPGSTTYLEAVSACVSSGASRSNCSPCSTNAAALRRRCP